MAVKRTDDELARKRAEKQAAAVVDEAFGISDDELARRFTDRHGHELRYVAKWGKWLRWDGVRWASDEKLQVFDLARAICREALTECLSDSTLKPAQERAVRHRLGSAATIWAVVKLAGTDPRHAVAVEQLDADPWKLNTPGGVVNLTTGAIGPHDPLAMHTKVTAATPGGECPLWQSFLDRVQPDESVREYLQRLCGYALTGSSREHILPFGYGGGRNGKGTFIHTVRAALGDYALEIPAETLMESHSDRHPAELAILRGAPLVVGSEIDSNRRWNESRLKRLTGGDPISARFMGKDPFEFNPTHTLFIVGNAKPGLRAVDEAIRSRIHLIPFALTIPEAERDATLPERLHQEFGAILAWALAGCLEWQQRGMAPPASVLAATASYLAAEDGIGGWLAECTEKGAQLTLKAAHQSYREWAEQNAQPILGRNTFADQLRTRGLIVDLDTLSKVTIITGIRLAVHREDNRYAN